MTRETYNRVGLGGKNALKPKLYSRTGTGYEDV